MQARSIDESCSVRVRRVQGKSVRRVGEKRVRHLTVTVPLGDAELVQRLGSHLNDIELRAAGATCIIKGEVRAC